MPLSVKLRGLCLTAIAWVLLAELALTSVAGAAPIDRARSVAVLTLEGSTLPFGKLLSNKGPGTVLLFWSLYQPDSRRALRAVDRLAHDLGGKDAPEVLTVALPEYKESPAAVADFLGRARVSARTVMDPNGELLASFTGKRGGATLPRVHVLAADGSVIEVLEGWENTWPETLAAAVSRLRKGTP